MLNNIKNYAKSIKRALSSENVKYIFKFKSVIVMIIYSLFPVDLIPDAVPFIGQVDDLFVIIWTLCNIVSSTRDAIPEFIKPASENVVQFQKNADKVVSAVKLVYGSSEITGVESPKEQENKAEVVVEPVDNVEPSVMEMVKQTVSENLPDLEEQQKEDIQDQKDAMFDENSMDEKKVVFNGKSYDIDI